MHIYMYLLPKTDIQFSNKLLAYIQNFNQFLKKARNILQCQTIKNRYNWRFEKFLENKYAPQPTSYLITIERIFIKIKIPRLIFNHFQEQ